MVNKSYATFQSLQLTTKLIMGIKNIIFSTICLCVLTLFSCTESTVIGEELVDDNQLPITSVDTVNFRMNTVLSDDFLALNVSQTKGSTPLGTIENPIFGKFSANLAFQIVEENISGFRDTINLSDIDSCVLNIPLAIDGILGDKTATLPLTIYSLTNKDAFSDSEVKTLAPITPGNKVYGTYNQVIPNTKQIAKVWTSDSFRIDTINPRLNIKLNSDFTADIFPVLKEILTRDTSINANDSILFERFPGLLVQSNGVGNSLATVDLTQQNYTQFSVKVYYKKNGKTKEFPFNFRRSNTTKAKFRRSYTYDASNSKVQTQLDAPNTVSDSLTYLLSPTGLMTEIEFYDLDKFKGLAVASAKLQIPVDTNITYETAKRIIPLTKNSVGDLVSIGSANSSSNAEYSALEGGVLKKINSPISGQDSIYVYELNIASHFQTILEGKNPTTLYLSVLNRHSLSGFSILKTKVGNLPKAKLFLATAKIP